MGYATVPFKRWHLTWLEDNGGAEGGANFFLSQEVLACLEQSYSHTMFSDEGKVLACAGALTQWPGRHTAWAYLNKDSGPHMTYVTRAARRCVDALAGRIELTVRCDYDAGHRWAKLLGFHVETQVMKHYGPEAEDHTQYVRFNR